MGRAKLNMELIQRENSRRTTFRKRKEGLKKKAEELSILCGVPVSLIITGPQQANPPLETEIWPENPSILHDMIHKYRTQPDEDRRKRTFSTSDFFEDRVRKVESTLLKLRQKNNESLYPVWDVRFNDLSEEQLREFACVLERNLDTAKTRVQMLKGMVKDEKALQNKFIYMHDLVRRRSTATQSEVIHHDHQQPPPISSVAPQISDFTARFGFDQGLPLDTIPVENPMMMMMNCYDFPQFGGPQAGNFVLSPVSRPPVYYDGMLESVVMMNNPNRSPACNYDPGMLPPTPQYFHYPL